MACPTWIFEGAVVGLVIDLVTVGKGRIISLDPDRVCHGVKLGSGVAYLLILEAFQHSTVYKEDETLMENVGSFSVWNIDDLVNLAAQHETHSQTGNTSSGVRTHNPPAQEALPVKIIPRSLWLGLEVKVMDETGFIFACASVQIVEYGPKLYDTTIDEDYVGIHLHHLVDGAGPQHLIYRDGLRAWSLDRLLLSDGHTLRYHFDHKMCLDQESKNNPSDRRSYMFKSRKRKDRSNNPSKKEHALSDENIAMVSTVDCCSRRCCQHFDRALIKQVRKSFWEMGYGKRKTHLLNILVNHIQSTTGEKIVTIEGMVICLDAWRVIHGLGKTQFYENLRKVRLGLRDCAHGNVGKRRMSENVSQGLMTTRAMVEENADHHPAKLRTIGDTSRQVLRELPTSFSWEHIRNTVNDVNKQLGLRPVSQPTMSILRARYFKEVTIHRKGNNFSKCTLCSEFELRKTKITCKEDKEALQKEITEHHHDHSNGRLLYHAWRDESIRRPNDVLCIIHDKMDHCKTALPRMTMYPKCVEGVFRMPITVTGILTHGHGPKAIAQYNVGVWPSDPNATIGSLDTILRMLEDPTPMVKSLIEGPDSTTLFSTLMAGRNPILKTNVMAAFDYALAPDVNEVGDPTSTEEGHSTASINNVGIPKKLPRVLKLQLDNCAGDNKNRYVFAYLSLLTARDIFEEVQLGFLMVGHTHEDVDAMFGHFSELLMHCSAWTLPHLMSMLMKTRKPNPVPHFVQELPDFKLYLKPYLLTGPKALIGHLKPRLFRFYKRHDGMPCFQYKIKSLDESWIPEAGVELWGWSPEHVPHLPTGNPKRLPLTDMKSQELVLSGLQKFVDYFKRVAGFRVHEAKNWDALIKYWERVITCLHSKIQYRVGDGEELKYGFWPVSRWKDHVPPTYRNFACEIETEAHYVGPQGQKPKECFQPLLDIKAGCGLFVLVRPDTQDLEIYPVYLAKVLKDPEEDGVNEEGKVILVCKVQYYRPWHDPKKVRPATVSGRYQGCWNKQWEENLEEEIQNIDINTVLWCFKAHINKHGRATISKGNAEKAKDNLRRCQESEGNNYIRVDEVLEEGEDPVTE